MKVEIEGRARPTTLAAFQRWSRVKNAAYSRLRKDLTGVEQSRTVRV